MMILESGLLFWGHPVGDATRCAAKAYVDAGGKVKTIHFNPKTRLLTIFFPAQNALVNKT